MILVKKYSNRRLYDTQDSRYVTLDELAAKIRAGAQIQVTDVTSGEDITQGTLAQIIFENQRAARLLPASLLAQLIRLEEDALADFMGRYVTWALDIYLQSMRQMQAMQRFNPFMPFPPPPGYPQGGVQGYGAAPFPGYGPPPGSPGSAPAGYGHNPWQAGPGGPPPPPPAPHAPPGPGVGVGAASGVQAQQFQQQPPAAATGSGDIAELRKELEELKSLLKPKAE